MMVRLGEISPMVTRRRWPKVAWVAAALVLTLAAVWLAFVARNYTVPITSYRAIDDRTIAVRVIGGSRTWCRVTTTQEAAAQIRIAAECLDWSPSPGTLVGLPVELTVGLADPLGDRVVVGVDGVPVVLADS